MEKKLYVGNLAYEITEDNLRSLLSKAGTVTSVDLIKDRDTGRSKGFAFVEMSSQSEAEQVIKDLNGKNVGNREIKVNLARPPKDRNRSSSNDYNHYGGGGSKIKRRKSRGGSRRY
jgi:RNA recognition motif-containing protein